MIARLDNCINKLGRFLNIPWNFFKKLTEVIIEEATAPILTLAGNIFMSSSNVYVHAGLTVAGNFIYLKEQFSKIKSDPIYNALKHRMEVINTANRNELHIANSLAETKQNYPPPELGIITKRYSTVILVFFITPALIEIVLGAFYIKNSHDKPNKLDNAFLWTAPFAIFFGKWITKGIIKYRIRNFKKYSTINEALLSEKCEKYIKHITNYKIINLNPQSFNDIQSAKEKEIYVKLDKEESKIEYKLLSREETITDTIKIGFLDKLSGRFPFPDNSNNEDEVQPPLKNSILATIVKRKQAVNMQEEFDNIIQVAVTREKNSHQIIDNFISKTLKEINKVKDEKNNLTTRLNETQEKLNIKEEKLKTIASCIDDLEQIALEEKDTTISSQLTCYIKKQKSLLELCNSNTESEAQNDRSKKIIEHDGSSSSSSQLSLAINP